MKSVEVKTLKGNLSIYLKLVKKGETITVTEQDEIIAEIKKPDILPISDNEKFNTFLKRGAKSGNLTLAKRKKSLLRKTTSKTRTKQSDWWPVYEEIRSDRF
jgi:antitoxin (DNA-binding transcriptional repressor) of toxin-antitoxin stability system